jgi:hypothetical protein
MNDRRGTTAMTRETNMKKSTNASQLRVVRTTAGKGAPAPKRGKFTIIDGRIRRKP